VVVARKKSQMAACKCGKCGPCKASKAKKAKKK